MVTWFTNLRNLKEGMIFLFGLEKPLHVTDVHMYTQLDCHATVSMLSFNPIMVDNYAAFFNCTPDGRASDSMMAST